ncbi:tabinhibitin 4-like [Uranotaenia lowii]|uniref:tabinhibitin 4-like n=1 Tax=Uranotaenia lowii TaxID=190385 RepID=UPI0024796AA3|nr:tabinhibitin 4-like [Uranotaenia lowii]
MELKIICGLSVYFLLLSMKPSKLEAAKCEALPDRCGPGEKDVTCTEQACDKSYELQELDRFQIPMLVNAHNILRNHVLKASHLRIPKPIRYPSVVWNKGLQRLAELHERNCRVARCVATKRFPNATVLNYGAKDIYHLTTACTDIIDRVGQDFNNLDMDQIRKYDGIRYKELKQILYGRTRRIGCALVWKRVSMVAEKEYRLTCVYDQRPIEGQPVYLFRGL